MSEKECEICYQEARLIKIGSCSHKFCAQCVHDWLQTHNSCPKCRSTKTRNSKEYLECKEVWVLKKLIGAF